MLALRVCAARRVFALGLGAWARGIASQPVGNKHAADLFDLVRFRLASARLQVENLQHIAAGTRHAATLDPGPVASGYPGGQAGFTPAGQQTISSSHVHAVVRRFSL